MATHRLPIDGPGMLPDITVYYDRVSNQISAAATPSVGDILAMVLADGGSDAGFKCNFLIPKNYVSAPKIVMRAILDGAPGATDVLGIGVRKRAVANNESADGTFDAEQTGSATIGSSGSAHSDEDEVELSVSLTAGDYSVDDTVYYYFFIDASANTYTGNVLMTGLFFEYSDS